jgi:hypothetical protein
MDSLKNDVPLRSQPPVPTPEKGAGSMLDVTNTPTPAPAVDGKRRNRPFLGIQFRCCRSYGRIYRNAAATAYEGHCPRCGSRVKVPIGPGGKDSRFFSAG